MNYQQQNRAAVVLIVIGLVAGVGAVWGPEAAGAMALGSAVALAMNFYLGSGDEDG